MPTPSVEELLSIDREFRRSGLPYLHTVRAGHHFSALFSCSALAERMGRRRDWVVIEVEAPDEQSKFTVVTEWRGVMKGKRVVRGRELECFAHYRDRGRIHHRAVA